MLISISCQRLNIDRIILANMSEACKKHTSDVLPKQTNLYVIYNETNIEAALYISLNILC